MADCSYARCIQERRFIKRELQKWTKNMVYIVGLERVAEELMGRRKWKQYQDIIQRSNLNLDATNLTQKSTSPVVNNGHHHHHTKNQEDENLSLIINKELTTNNHIKNEKLTENNNQEKENLSTEEDNIESDKTKVTKGTTDTETRNCESLIKKEESLTLDQSRTSLKNEDIKEENSLPVDWKPQDKCYFCVDGKLLTVNEAGELVAESGPVSTTEADLTNNRIHDSDSDSSESEQDQSRKQIEQANKQLTAAFLRQAQGLGTNMTSFESMAAQLAAVASLHGLQPGLAPFYPGLWYGLQQQAQQQDTPQSQTSRINPTQTSQSPSLTEPNASSSPNVKSTPPDLIAVGSGGEQPLDLSAKPSGSSSREPSLMLKAKPRIATIPGRRSYTEEELQSALRDILSGKLGTRRAAVIYGIPRSTLRNKVYKFTLENRQQLPRPEVVLPAILGDEDDDKEEDGDDDMEPQALRTTPGSLSPEELLRLSSNPALAQVALQRLLLDSQKTGDATTSQQPLPQSEPPKIPTPQTPPVIPPLLDPSLLLQLQGLLLAGGGIGALAPGLLSAKPEELAALQKLMLSQQELFKEQLKHIQNQTSGVSASRQEQNLSNGQDLSLLQNLSFLQQQQQQQQQLQKQLRKSSATPDGVLSGGEMNESDMLLRIPSYKPVVAGSSSASKNGEAGSSSSHTPPALRPVVPNSPHNHHLPITSPPIGRLRSESESPPTLLSGHHKGMLSISEVIAKSISKNFQQHVDQQQQHPKMHHHHHHPTPLGLDLMDQYKRPSISVIKNLGSVERFGQGSSLSPGNNTGTGGKGTRPKRGKYRNYDRDSLVEAVKAVQRGEMSVHRAGSYYGVPHSTLEYKVKERHLMRPRKREPKPQPLDGTSTTSAGSSSSKQSQDLSVMRAQLDKKPPLGKTPPFPSTSPNGMKMPPMFDSAMANQLQYSSPFMWPHHPSFAGLPGLPGAAGQQQQQQQQSQQPPTFPPNAEHLFAQHMMQRFQQQEDTPANNRNGGGSNSSGSKTPNNGSTSGASTPASGKSARELVESIYDANTNGSFLDGIIRHSLDKKPAEMNHGALFDQLLKNNRSLDPSADHGPSNAAMVAASALIASHSSRKRSGSPLSFAQTEIKRERASPDTGSDSDQPSSHDAVSSDYTKETVDQLIKLRQSMVLKMEKGKDDINGGNDGTTSNDDDNIQHDDIS